MNTLPSVHEYVITLLNGVCHVSKDRRRRTRPSGMGGYLSFLFWVGQVENKIDLLRCGVDDSPGTACAASVMFESSTGMNDRAEDVCGDGEWVYPEEFWGCADIEITADGGGGEGRPLCIDYRHPPARLLLRTSFLPIFVPLFT